MPASKAHTALRLQAIFRALHLATQPLWLQVARRTWLSLGLFCSSNNSNKPWPPWRSCGSPRGCRQPCQATLPRTTFMRVSIVFVITRSSIFIFQFSHSRTPLDTNTDHSPEDEMGLEDVTDQDYEPVRRFSAVDMCSSSHTLKYQFSHKLCGVNFPSV